MSSKHLLKYLLILTLLFLMVSALPVSAQEPTAEPTVEQTVEPAAVPTDEPAADPTEEAVAPPAEEPTTEPAQEPTDEPTQEPTDEPTAEPTQEPTTEPTVEPTQEPTTEPTVEVTVEPTVEVTVEPTVEPTVEATATLTPTIEAVSEDVSSSGTLAGSFTSQVIAIANLNAPGSTAEAGSMNLYTVENAGTTGSPAGPSLSVYPGGVQFIRASDLPSNGEFSAILQTGFPAAAAVLITNSTAKTADTYPSFDSNSIGEILYGPIIYNKHASFESTLYCQNAGSAATTIEAELYQRKNDKIGEPGGLKHTLTSNSLDPGEGVKWDIADNAAVQAAWPGGSEKFGYVKFLGNGQNIACVVDSHKMTASHVQATYSAVKTDYASNELNIPLIYNGHGSSSSSNRATKVNSGFAIVNVGSDVTASVKYTANNGYEVTCTQSVQGGASINWYTPAVWANGDGGAWSCDKPFPLTWTLDQTSFGSAKLTAPAGSQLLGITNHTQLDGSKASGYPSLGVPNSKATNRAICPLAFNKNPANDFVTGVRVALVDDSSSGTGSTTVTWTQVKAGVDPTASGNSNSNIQKTITEGAGKSAYFPAESQSFTNFEGAVFVQSSNANHKILATSVNSHFGALDSIAMYDCINY